MASPVTSAGERKGVTAEFDYVIVGAGSAGCALANRLSEDPGKSVALIEAGGGNHHISVSAPAGFPKQFRTKRDWDFNTEPEPHCDDRSLYIPRGKSIGGSSSMNAMLYVRGRASDYDGWEVPGWSWNDVREYFLRAENNERGASAHHATGGPLNVMDPRSPCKLTARFIDAAHEAGFDINPDYNGDEQRGASVAQVTQRDGRRFSAADAYLTPVRSRANLTILKRKHVTAVEFAGDRAVGVRMRGRWGGESLIRARDEVILAAGAIGSPQLLLLSGIGPADDLRAVGVPLVADAPGVGMNLHDHPYLTCCWKATGESLYGADKLRYLAEWLMRHTGPLTSTIAEAFLFTDSRDGLPEPDLQLHFAAAYFNDHGFDEYEDHAFTTGPVLLNPKSRGSVRLRSNDPLAKPAILTNTLAHPDDLAALVAGVRIARRIADAGPLAEVNAGELLPGPGAETDEQLAADARERVNLLYHPVGTCRMGTDDEAVVDQQTRVRGVEGLRVVDASIMPVIPGGNTNAPTIMVAERAADLIRGRVPAAESATAVAAAGAASRR